jgi:hypothetical protein
MQLYTALNYSCAIAVGYVWSGLIPVTMYNNAVLNSAELQVCRDYGPVMIRVTVQ